jgi:predicted nuclease with TOPRIM domain
MSYRRLHENNDVGGDRFVDSDQTNEADANESSARVHPAATPIEKKGSDVTDVRVLRQRHEMLENEVSRLHEQHTKSRIHVKELEQRLNELEGVIQGLLKNKSHSSSFTFGRKPKAHVPSKLQGEDEPSMLDDANNERILPSKRSSSRETIIRLASVSVPSQYH